MVLGPVLGVREGQGRLRRGRLGLAGRAGEGDEGLKKSQKPLARKVRRPATRTSGICKGCGHCCRAFYLNATKAEMARRARSGHPGDVYQNRFVRRWFRRIPPKDGEHRKDRPWYTCLALGPDNNCTQYENRPWMCRTALCEMAKDANRRAAKNKKSGV